MTGDIARDIGLALAGLILGGAIGAAYFTLLLRALDGMSSAPPLRTLALYVLRFAGAAAGFWLIAQMGAVALIAALAGFMISRRLMQRRITPGA